MENNTNEVNSPIGIVKISDDVVAVYAARAASEVSGVVNFSSGLVNGITHKISGKKDLSKGIKVTLKENSAVIDINIVVDYGVKIQEIAKNVQENVKETVETLTGLNIDAINVIIQDVYLEKEDKQTKDSVSTEE